MATYGPFLLEDLADNETVDVLVIDDNFHKLSTGSVALATSGTPVVQAIGDTAARGTGTVAAHDDHKHGMPAFGTPVTQAFGDSVAAGSATTIARSDHRHGMPAGIETLTVGRKVVQAGDLASGIYVVPSSITDVFTTVNCTVQLPAPSSTARKIFVEAVTGSALLTATGGSTVIGGSYNTTTGVLISPTTLVQGDSGEYHTDGSNWRL